jgi:hypothetical protein
MLFQKELKRSFHQIRGEISDLRQMLVARRRDRIYRELKYQTAALHFETALNRHFRVSGKAG